MPIEYLKGDLLTADDVDVFLHGCNCQGVWGAGIAKQIRCRWPEVFQQYTEYFTRFYSDARVDFLGQAHLAITNDGKEVISLQTQLRYGRGRRQVNYAALAKAVFDAASGYEDDTAIGSDGIIGMPKIGCGLAGGDWAIVSAIVEDAFGDRKVRVYEL